ncbi:MAG TPA: hypothetical protein VH054_07155, partial [Polyangiaceae bacterium]|nr:hypothetical protein [Polyangiaceae bacterium]
MEKIGKKILDRLKASKVSTTDITRTRDLIDEAHDWDAANESELVEAVVRYVCGVEPTLPKLDRDFLENKARELVNG